MVCFEVGVFGYEVWVEVKVKPRLWFEVRVRFRPRSKLLRLGSDRGYFLRLELGSDRGQNF